MFQTGIKQQLPTAAGVATMLSHLSLGDRFVMLFNEPASLHPHQLHVWHGVVVTAPDRWRKRAVCFARFEEGGLDMVYPLPPPHRDVTVVDVIRDPTSSAASPFSQPLQMASFAGASTLAAAQPPSSSHPETERDAAVILNGIRSFSTTDLGDALSRHLYPHRKIIVWVCMPTIMCEDLVDDLDAVAVVKKDAAEARTYIRENITTILAVVASGVCGPELCGLVRTLRKTATLPPGAHPGERCWPLAIIATRTLHMNDCIDSCDIFVNSLTSADSICLTEISRRVAPPSVVCVDVALSDSLRHYVESTLGFSVHHFDTTYRAYQFVVACPWNVASIITDRCQDLHREGHLTGVELGLRVRELNLSRFRDPHLILVGAPGLDTKAFDHVILKEKLEDGALKGILTTLAKSQQGVRVPEAVVFGRGASTILNPTFPSPLEVTIDGESMTFPNVEQFFQAAKHYGNRELFCSIRDAPSIHGALKLAWEVQVDTNEWNDVRDEVMWYALTKKFSDAELMNKLLLTGNKDIVHSTFATEDSYWGDGADGLTHRGRNRLGEMLMTLRSMLREHMRPTNFEVEPVTPLLVGGVSPDDVAELVATNILHMDCPLR